ncbi:MAG: exodeoxyribonuclease VII small subunit [Alphaproteobacteria bacterium]|nr:exodeoxyribonuclease VII small subunit [Alphaproteobacteria bacterium]
MKQEDLKNLTFETALQKLEQIVQSLEAGQIKLDDAVEAYEKAMFYKKFCEEKLNAASLKIEKIENNQAGKLELKPFDQEGENA